MSAYEQDLMANRLAGPSATASSRQVAPDRSAAEWVALWNNDECELVLDGLSQTNRVAPPSAPDPALFIATGEKWIVLLRRRLAQAPGDGASMPSRHITRHRASAAGPSVRCATAQSAARAS